MFILATTTNGLVKKTKIEKYRNINSSGLIAIDLRSNDQLVNVHLTNGNQRITMVTQLGKCITFNESELRPTGRDTQGVKGIALKSGDKVITSIAFPAKLKQPKDKRRKFFHDILIVTKKGLGKRTRVDEYPCQRRGGQGVKVANLTDKSGKISAALEVTHQTEQIIITTKKAQIIKLPFKNIPTLGRDTQGVILLRFAKKGDTVAAVTATLKPSL